MTDPPGQGPSRRLHQRRSERIGRPGDAVRDRSGQRMAALALGEARPAPARRFVRGRDLQAAAERHRLLDPEAARDPRPQLRRRRRQLRVPHRARHAGPAVAAGAARHRRERRRDRQCAAAVGHHTPVPTATPPTSTSAGTIGVRFGSAGSWITSLLSVLLGMLGWLRVTRFLLREEGAGRWLLGLVVDDRRGDRDIAAMIAGGVGAARGARGVSPLVRASGPALPDAGRCRRGDRRG